VRFIIVALALVGEFFITCVRQVRLVHDGYVKCYWLPLIRKQFNVVLCIKLSYRSYY
jgi:hypothetical protein